MADYTPKEAAELLRLVPGAIQQAVETEQAIAVIDLEGDIKQRVFLEGQTNTGGTIGSYDTSPMYVSIAGARLKYGGQLPLSKLKPRGKNVKGRKAKTRTVNEDGELVQVERKSVYFPDGYQGFRSAMGRAVDKVNLKLTGNLSNSIASGTEGSTSTVAFTNEKASKVASGNEEHFTGKGTIFKPSKDEVDELGRRLREAAERALNKLFP